MSTSVESTITVSFDADGETTYSPITISYRFDRNAVELRQGDHVVWVPFGDTNEFAAILSKWLEENT